jgi:hypothetical protein
MAGRTRSDARANCERAEKRWASRLGCKEIRTGDARASVQAHEGLRFEQP